MILTGKSLAQHRKIARLCAIL